MCPLHHHRSVHPVINEPTSIERRFGFNPLRVLAALGVVSLIPVGLIVALTVYDHLSLHARPFTRVDWNSAQDRWGMCGDLLGILKSCRTRAEVEALLGPPEGIYAGHASDYGGSSLIGQTTLSYTVGNGHRGDDDFLYIHRDGNEGVIDFGLYGY